MNKPATIKDIARQLSISVSTVSRAMRNAPDVNIETRKAVLALSEELRYQPNKLALSLKQKQTFQPAVADAEIFGSCQYRDPFVSLLY